MDNKIKVSELFLDIYKNFNVSDQRDRLNLLSREELYILLETCIDRHDSDDQTVLFNLSTSCEEMSELRNLHKDKEFTDQDLKDLQNKFSDLIFEIETQSGEELPEPYTKDQVRELKLNKIFDK